MGSYRLLRKSVLCKCTVYNQVKEAETQNSLQSYRQETISSTSSSASYLSSSTSNATKQQRLQIAKRNALWHLNVAAMPHSVEGESCFDWSVFLGGDIPFQLRGRSYTLETGLRYLNKRSAVLTDLEFFDGNASFVEIPVRLAYDLPLVDDLSLRMSAGPYFSYMFSAGGGTQIGIEPSVALKYKNFSVGLQYSLPVYKGYTNEYSNVVMLTLGLRFNNKGWKYIGAGAAAIGAAAIVVSDVLDRSSANSNSGNANSNYGGDVQNIPENASSTSSSNKKNRKCAICLGSGRCTSCAGRGMKQISKTREWIDCSICRGTGKCTTCNGSGRPRTW